MSIVKSFSFPNGDIRGDMFYIKHDSDNFTVIDCFLKDGDDANCRKDEIIAEIKRESASKNICRFISTHPDDDHIRGIEYLDDDWKILNFYAVKNDRPADKNDASLTRYQWLLGNRNFEVRTGIERRWINLGDEKNEGSDINFYWPNVENEEFKKALKAVSEGNDINNICPVFTYSNVNGATYMWMGDLETEMQQVYYNENKNHIPKVDILFHPHHGRHTGAVPDELMKALNPKIVVLGNAPSDHLNYMNPNLTITQNTAGDIRFENEGRYVHVYTRNEISNAPTCLNPYIRKYNITYDGILWYYAGTLIV